ncbi:zf-CCCH type zinc finger protein [Schizosaccharomyces cryophilus OY26]|uniref:Zf-CCCH type zinc finger protein n=1 Tax=Schizosaccharomyces cryophilus (strain OY26 / ATCC MYA-4695 / CBS 11777 / NBRC 106824 / NRRL Y48691) TaxID=653667 RepID=S9X277_SCHCR|nr:zf-CCCH type zinc finger protein [Schizosaccharomyces cryophilus OY26]EPY51212.1 zf-CCCH type zinc finger protein [Schizosaccharomyces cryophilus OY26]
MITMSTASSAAAKRMEPRPLDNRRTVKSPLPKLAQDHVAPVKNLQHVPCKFFRHGTCTAGENCPFSHSLETERPVCKYHLKGNCKFGSKCALSHSLPVNDATNPAGLSSDMNPATNHPFGLTMKHMPSSSISSSFPQKIQRTAFDQVDLKGSVTIKSNLLNPALSASPPSFAPFSPGRSSASSYMNNITSTQSMLGSINSGKQLDDYSSEINTGLTSSMNGISIAPSSLATSPSSFSAASSSSSTNVGGAKGLLHQQMSNESNRDYFTRHPSLLATYANRPSSERTPSLSKLTPAESVKPNVPLQSPQLSTKLGSSLSKRRPSVNHSLTGIQLSSGATRRYAVRSNSYADAFPSVVSTSLPNRVDLNHQMDMSDDEQRYLNTPMGSLEESFLGSSPIGKMSSSLKQLSAPLSMMSPTLTPRSTANTLQNSRFGAYFSKSKYAESNTGSTKTTPQQSSVAGAPMKMPSSFGVREESVFSSPTNEITRPQHLARLKSEPIFRGGSVSPVGTGGINDTKNDYTLSPGNNGSARVSFANTFPAWNSTLEEETTFQMDD